MVSNNGSAAWFGPIDEISDEDWDFAMRNEIDPVFFVTPDASGFITGADCLIDVDRQVL